MSSTINATTVGVGGIVATADNSGILVLQTASTTALTISAAQGVTLAGTLGVTGATTLSTTLGVTGATTLSSTLAVTGITTVAAGTAALPSIISTTGTADTGEFFPAADTIAWSTAGTERMRIGSTGLVGIGTTAPLSQLDVSIAIVSPTSGEATGVGAIRITNGTSALTSAGGLEFKIAGDNNGYGSKIQALNSGGSQLVFANRYATGTWTERMRINNDGNVGIGTTSPANKLEVSGSLLQGSAWAVIGAYNAAATFPTPTDNAVAFAWNFTNGGRDVTMMNNDYSGAGVRFVQRTGAATSGYVGRGGNGGDWFQGNNSASWSTVSDIRIKQNVRPLNDSLAKITALNPCHFEYKNTPDKIKTGFIAQEFEQVLPGHVQESEPDVLFSEYFDLEAGEKMKSIDPDLIPYLVGAIKELKAIIDTQSARITALETA